MLALSVESVSQADGVASQASDAAPLVARAQKGDRVAMTTLLRRYEPMVRGIAMARVGATDAPDVCQEAFLESWRRLHQLRDPSAFGPWLATIVRNRATEFLRQRRSSSLRASSLRVGDNAQDVGSADHARVEALRVLDLIRQLPESYSETLVLRLIEGLTGPQIAACTGLTAGSARVNLHRGMAMLRERLGTTCRENVS
jgi:RNA polymerase sigma-70 factor (ECF subfamily)